MAEKRIILASGSPRRRELLSKMGYTFETCSPDVDEHVSGLASDIVRILCIRKAHAAKEHIFSGVIIASDTLVSLDGAPLGKPADRADAKRMLQALSGRGHDVFTGVCILDAESGQEEVRVERTGVHFKPLTDTEIDAYVQTDEPLDKAGAYAIQGGAGAFVDFLDGSFDNVMGFPTDAVREMLAHFGL